MLERVAALHELRLLLRLREMLVFCQDQAVVKPMQKGLLYAFKMENCTGCKKCADECPCGFIDMV